MPGQIDDKRLRKLLRSSPATAIEILYHHYYRSLLNISRHLTSDEKASEDIVQETFVHVWENYKSLSTDHERSLQFYLVRVVKNKSITHYKNAIRSSRQNAEYFDEFLLSLSQPSVETTVIKSETGREIREVISTFPRREKECLLMKLDEEMTVGQMSERLQISGKAVERSLTSAKKRLKKYWITKAKNNRQAT